MQVSIGLGLRVLLGNARAELEVGTHGLAERLVVWQTGLVERFHVQRNEPLPLLVSDLQVAVRIESRAESRGQAPTERLGDEPGQMIDVIGGAAP